MSSAGGRTVALFGGSFNPPHIAHLLAATYVRAMHESIDALWIIPCFSHAFAKSLVSFEHRVSMCERTFVSLPNVEISLVEKHLDGPSRTIRTVRHLTDKHPGWRFRLVIGSDILAEGHRWEKFDELLELAAPIVLGRVGWAGGEGACLPNVSSTEIRDAIARGDNDYPSRWVVPSVMRYIQDNRLYGSGHTLADSTKKAVNFGGVVGK